MGHDNSNIHFQVAIHLGHPWLMLKTVHKGTEDDYLEVCYSCNECEEILEDQLITNESKLPYMTVLKDNPLLYTQIKNVDPIVAESGGSKWNQEYRRSRCEDAKRDWKISCVIFVVIESAVSVWRSASRRRLMEDRES
ncbi:hypothetical protein B7P43_G16219 [Cryptotermes secundus]|uniref:Uncharacterized protein n=1 Tax=Cryptotermes secundus TaxID=105785 RepID=A0A2J7RT87_9NEOP|nr:hypothetical protein B7P43_G16219 [Cryptotermes secundus]